MKQMPFRFRNPLAKKSSLTIDASSQQDPDAGQQSRRETIEIGSEESRHDGDKDAEPADEDALENRKEEDETQKRSNAIFNGLASSLLKFTGGGGRKNDKGDEEAIRDIVAKVRERVEQGDSEESGSLREIIDMLNEYKSMLGSVGRKYIGSIDLRKLTPTAIMYYLECEDELKNPSYKRRQHRFCPGIKISEVNELYDFLKLANLCYADTADDIKSGLEAFKTPYDLVYVNVKSSPGKPANFVAVKRDQSSRSSMKKISTSLRVIIGVRGTKTAADAVTDLLCETVEYRGGQAHAMILESGKFIAEKHRDLLEELREKSGKKRVKLTLIGHSLGAGAASIAGMEFHALKDPKLVVNVVGFGCPALVSRELAEDARYITTVINDSDVVCRMSGVSVANLLLRILQFDWLEYARNDVRHILSELGKRQPKLFNDSTRTMILNKIEPLLENYADATRLPLAREIPEVEIYPPGKCIHFYRDGYSISGAVVPNNFFAEIDVTRRMIDDHLFHSGYEKTLLEVVREYEKDHHFRFDG